MEILIFTDNKTLRLSFSEFVKMQKIFSIRFIPRAKMKKGLKSAAVPAVVYIDISDFSPAERIQSISTILDYKGELYCGIINPLGVKMDVAQLFQMGVHDYIDPYLLRKAISPKRIQRMIEHGRSAVPVLTGKAVAETQAIYKLSGNSWSDIDYDKEYTFCFMFIELDNHRDLTKNMSHAHRAKSIEAFRYYIESNISSLNGKVWMWRDYVGLAIFPFDGVKCEAITEALRLMLSRLELSIGNIGFNALVSYRIALHLGNTIYKKSGDTGTVISDSINSIFHLGQKFAQPDTLYLTGELSPYIPEGLSKLFVPAGIFEGRKILRMRSIS